MENGSPNSLPDWAEIIDGEQAKPDDGPVRKGGHGKGGHARHGKRAADNVSTGEHVLQCSIGIVFTIVILLVAQIGWMFYGNDLDSIHTQIADSKHVSLNRNVDLDSTRIAQPQSGEPPVDGTSTHGQVIGWMYIPKIETGWKRAIQQGTDQVVLDNQGIGHYEQTVMPGAVGNSAYAGHRTGGDLGYVDRLQAGDAIVIQTAEHWYVYRMTEGWVTDPTDVGVLDTDESDPDARELTLTTCHPMSAWADESVKHRYIVRARFSYWANVSDGIPAELSTADANPVGKAGYKWQQTVRAVSTYAPASLMFGVALLAVWAILNGLCWLLWHKDRERKPSSWNVLVLSWRLQQGVLPLRVLNLLLFWGGLLLLFWWGVGPRFCSWFPFLRWVGVPAVSF